jgi:hypothetical protein
VRQVIPGHGAPFEDVAAALSRARSRLAGFVADPDRHARHAAKVLVKYHLLEEGQQSLPALSDWAEQTPLLRQVWHKQGRPQGSVGGWSHALAQELVHTGALVQRGQTLHNR